MPYFQAVGGKGLLLIMVAVDVVIGPLLTLVVFDRNRKPLKELRRDLAVIAALQLAALGYGVLTVFEARPVFTVFAVDRFEVVTANEIEPELLAKAKRPEFSTLSVAGPALVAADTPGDAKERGRLIFAASEGIDVKHFPEYYVPYAERSAQALQRAKPLSSLIDKRPETKGRIEEFLVSSKRQQQETVFLPLSARTQDFCVLLDRKDGKVVGFLGVDPWI